jgi:acyl carrier protein phosphodiesterase
MNYLAHAMLSPDDDLVMVGNLVGDFVRSLDGIPPRLREGVVLHRRIDRVANEHPAFRRSAQRLVPTMGHYARAAIDILYDHLLARDFSDFGDTGSLDSFVADVDRRFQSQRLHLPAALSTRWESVAWLSSYAHIDGIRRSLHRLSQRSRRTVDLTVAMPLLEAHHEALKDDLNELFPALKEVVRESQALREATSQKD